MSKIGELTMEVIRFETEDIIASSGRDPVTYAGFDTRYTYVAMAEELRQGGYDYSDSSWYEFKYTNSGSTNTFTAINPLDSEFAKYHRYAWFKENSNQWYTINGAANDYEADGIFPRT